MRHKKSMRRPKLLMLKRRPKPLLPNLGQRPPKPKWPGRGIEGGRSFEDEGRGELEEEMAESPIQDCQT